MKTAICNETFGDAPFDTACRIAAECGYDGIELAPFTFDPDVRRVGPEARAEIRRTAERHGLEVVGLHWLLAQTEGLHLTHTDPAVRARTRAYLEELVAFCRDVGGYVMVFGSPQQRNLLPGVTFAQGVEYACEVLKPVCARAAAEGITIAFEPLSPESTNFGGSLREGLTLIEAVDHPNLRLHFDTIAMSCESEPLDRLAAAHLDLIAHIHVNDVNRLGPGMGDLDLAPLIRTLKAKRYAGYLSVEVFRTDPGPERIARESIAYLRSLL